VKKELPSFSENFSRNGIYKIVSLAVALVIWATTLTEKKDAILVRDMEVEFLLRSNQRLVNPMESKLQIKVSGPKAALRRMSQTSRVVSVNLYQDAAGSKEVEFSSRMLELPPNVRLLSVRPNRIKVDIEEAPQQ
jgi:YbbR domain-containing protein